MYLQCDVTENSKEEALMTVAPLRARIAQLAQKCREKVGNYLASCMVDNIIISLIIAVQC